jgi:2-C-methyl-D-erythritol 4-phosphate cytidylyltransferase
VVEGSVWGVVYAAGEGARFGGRKQFETLGHERLVDRCVRTLAATCDHVVVVLPPGTDWDGPAANAAVAGGATNPDSVRAGVAAVAPDASIIVLHSPSHPLASRRLVRRLVEHLAATPALDGACSTARAHDALQRVDDDGNLYESIDRRAVVAIPVPLAFRADVARAALTADTSGHDALTIVQQQGGRIGAIAGESTNLHVTTRDELEMARLLLPLVDRADADDRAS